MLGQVSVQRGGQVEPRDEEADACVPRDELRRPAGGQADLLAHGCAAERRVAAPELDDPDVVVAARGGRGEPELEPRAVRARRRERRRERRRRVDDDEIAWGEEARQVDEAGVLDSRAGRVGDEQPDVVAAAAARLRRLVGLEPVGQLEGQRAHADALTSSRAR